MAKDFTEIGDTNARLELESSKGMAKVIDLGGLDIGVSKIAVDYGADVANQERSAGLGDKQVGTRSVLGALGEIVLDGYLGGFGKRNCASGIVFYRSYINFGFLNIL